MDRRRKCFGYAKRPIQETDLSNIEHAQGRVIGQEWQLLDRLDGGSFSQVYVALRNKKLYVAKQESREAIKKHLWSEYQILKCLRGCKGVPKVYFWEMIDGYQYVIMELVGPNLKEMYNVCDCSFSEYTLSHILLELIPILKHIHSHGILHRDLKPENIVLGKWPNKARSIYLIDFGLAKQYVYKDAEGKTRHLPKKNLTDTPRKGITGTLSYSSVGSHYGNIGRGSDIENLGYIISFFLLNASLPWFGVVEKTKTLKVYKILKLKKEADFSDLLHDKSPEFGVFLKTIRELEYEQKPNYKGYMRLFQEFQIENNYTKNTPLDWEKEEIISQKWPPSNQIETQERNSN